MRKLTILAAASALTLTLAVAGPAPADDAVSEVTFNKDILPVLQRNCQDCHRPAGLNSSGSIAPMSLMTYEEVRPWTKSILKAVKNRSMPPWLATEATHGVFMNERSLTNEEIAAVEKWVQSGAPLGSPEVAPPPKQFGGVDGWSIGKPDLVVGFNEPYFVADDVWDHYEYIKVKLTDGQLPEDKFIKALEFKPGSRVVHHIIAFATGPGDKSSPDRGMIGGMAPGTNPPHLPEGYGIPLKKGSTVIFQMHYHKEKGPGTGVFDSSQIAFIFQDKPTTHPVVIEPISHGGFEIPPGHPHWRVGMARTWDHDIDVMSLLPHSHLRGTAAKYVAFYPDGRVETLLDVPKYDFNWQIDYIYNTPKRIPAGTRIEAQIWYDNSPARTELAPEVDSTKSVRFGQPTTDEMDLAWITFADSEPITIGSNN